jgi:hypothetical protein
MSETKTLDLVDAALAEGRPTATTEDDRSLQLLALAIAEETRPEADPDFAREIDEWAAAGFHRGGPPDHGVGPIGAALDWCAHVLRSPIGLAGAGTAVAAVVIAAVLISDSSQDVTTGGGQPEFSAGRAAGAEPVPSTANDSATGGGSSSAAAPPAYTGSGSGSGGAAPQETNTPRIERSAQLTVVAPKDKFDSVADQVLRVTDRHKGFVLSSSVSTGDSSGNGDFTLRVPADELQPTLRDLSELGHVTTRSQRGQDVTQQYVSATDKLQSARAERRSLLRRLAKATDDAQANRLRDRLDQNAIEINTLRGQVREVLGRTNYSTIALTLQRSDKDSGSGGGAGSGTDAALHDSLGLLVGSFNWLLRALGVLIPAGIVGGAAWTAGRTLRRRRREAVLF